MEESLYASPEGTYGLLAEFDTPSDLVRAARQAREDGWRRMDCYTPYPVEEAAEAIGFHRNKVPLVTLIGGIDGPCRDVFDGDLDLDARLSAQHRGTPDSTPGRRSLCPPMSGRFSGPGCRRPSACWPCNGLPALYHPLFNAPNFRDGATTDKFFLCLEALDPKFDLVESRPISRRFEPVSVVEVEY